MCVYVCVCLCKCVCCCMYVLLLHVCTCVVCTCACARAHARYALCSCLRVNAILLYCRVIIGLVLYFTSSLNFNNYVLAVMIINFIMYLIYYIAVKVCELPHMQYHYGGISSYSSALWIGWPCKL